MLSPWSEPLAGDRGRAIGAADAHPGGDGPRGGGRRRKSKYELTRPISTVRFNHHCLTAVAQRTLSKAPNGACGSARWQSSPAQPMNVYQKLDGDFEAFGSRGFKEIEVGSGSLKQPSSSSSAG